MGFSRRGIEHRVHTGRLHLISRGVYAVGRRELTPHGRWMAAFLACGDQAALRSAAVSPSPAAGFVHRHGIPVTTPVQTLIDLAAELHDLWLERAVDQADVLDLVDPETFRTSLEDHKGEPA